MDSLTHAFSRLTRNERRGVILATQSAKNRASEQSGDRCSEVMAEIYALVGNAAARAQADEDELLGSAERQIRQDRRKRLGLDLPDTAASPFDR